MQQPNECVQPLLPTEHEFLYGSKAFKFLIFADLCMVAATFITLIYLLLADNPQSSLLFMQSYTLFVAGMPTVLGPTIIWLVFMMPFSYATKR